MVLELIVDLLPAAFFVVVSLWAATSLFLLVDRMTYDRTWGRVRRAIEAIDADVDPEGAIATIPRRTLERIASDASTSEKISRAIARHLARSRGTEVYVRQSLSMVSGFRKWRRIASVRILYHSDYDGILPLLEKLLADEDEEIVGAAVPLLGHFPNRRAAELLIELLVEERYPASRIATQLDRFPLRIPGELLPLLGAPAPIARFWGVTLLSRYGDEPQMAARLAALARDEDARVRKAVAAALGRLAAASEAPVVAALLEDDNWFVRAHAARAMAEMRETALASRLVPLLADREWWVRLAAKESLEAMGPDVIPVLLSTLDHPDRFARNSGAEVLQNLGFLDQQLSELVRNPGDAAAEALVGKLLIAGETGMMESSLRRHPDAISKLGALLRSMGVSLSRTLDA